ncbi:hypothetical protein E2C01_040302 [Portunus trituberculatus]|uniref:Uncharacterized protein n=1 Tax=Portunus trituberculatus TaxID=210409 RepID=A0A5B7FG51_PORTR|nr:hypothetical protein [Portunus trituberculatus]
MSSDALQISTHRQETSLEGNKLDTSCISVLLPTNSPRSRPTSLPSHSPHRGQTSGAPGLYVPALLIRVRIIHRPSSTCRYQPQLLSGQATLKGRRAMHTTTLPYGWVTRKPLL